ncbi:hypothetical protein DPMN_062025 [Dreissena polymorpha]|uniref:Uncharacterized protein n=1 Tax=Dreissena polymorpha TaxID=45954 RepID=A0A9D4HIZ3_DREPO|nr:hypothetical protein DPMN_062025 [Dreissena polymorpha]
MILKSDNEQHSYGPDKLVPPARQPARQPARIRQSNNQFFPSENLVKTRAPSADADRSSIFFLKVKGLSFSITKEGGCGGVGVGTGDGLVVSSKYQSNLIINKEVMAI